MGDERKDQPGENMREDAWLIEKGGLCFGVECNKPAWVTFASPNAIRFLHQRDAENMLVSWRSFGDCKDALAGCIVTGHSWIGPASLEVDYQKLAADFWHGWFNTTKHDDEYFAEFLKAHDLRRQ